MAHSSGEHRSDGILATLAERLRRGADSFTPEREADAPGELPGRRRGANLPAPSSTPTGAAAVVLDCGTSRRDGSTHVLWISPSVESLLGSAAAEQVGACIGAIDGVLAWTWEGADRLHVNAPDLSHQDVLDGARAAVEALASR